MPLEAAARRTVAKKKKESKQKMRMVTPKKLNKQTPGCNPPHSAADRLYDVYNGAAANTHTSSGLILSRPLFKDAFFTGYLFVNI